MFQSKELSKTWLGTEKVPKSCLLTPKSCHNCHLQNTESTVFQNSHKPQRPIEIVGVTETKTWTESKLSAILAVPKVIRPLLIGAERENSNSSIIES